MTQLIEKAPTKTCRAPFRATVGKFIYGVEALISKETMEDALANACANLTYADRAKAKGHSESYYIPNVVKEGIVPFVTEGKLRGIISRKTVKGEVVSKGDYKKDYLDTRDWEEKEAKSTCVFDDCTPIGGNFCRVDWFISVVAQYEISEHKFIGLVVNVYDLSVVPQSFFDKVVAEAMKARAKNDKANGRPQDSSRRDKPKFSIQKDIISKMSLKPTYVLTCNAKGKITS